MGFFSFALAALCLLAFSSFASAEFKCNEVSASLDRRPKWGAIDRRFSPSKRERERSEFLGTGLSRRPCGPRSFVELSFFPSLTFFFCSPHSQSTTTTGQMVNKETKTTNRFDQFEREKHNIKLCLLTPSLSLPPSKKKKTLQKKTSKK